MRSMVKTKLLTLLIPIVILIALPVFATEYIYDNLGRLTEVRYDNGQIINYTYDAGGNILSATTNISGKTTFGGESPKIGSTQVVNSFVISVNVADTESNLVESTAKMLINNAQVATAFEFDIQEGEYSYKKGTLSYNAQDLSNGEYKVDVEIANSKGIVTTYSWEFTVAVSDTTFNTPYPANGGTIGFMSPTIRIDVSNQFSDLDAATVKMNFNDLAVVPTFEYEEVYYDSCSAEISYNYKKGTIHYYAPNLADGTYPVTVEIADKLGNKATYSWEFTVAVTPTINQYLPASGSIHNSVDLIRAKVADANGTINTGSIVMKLNNQVVTHSFDAATGYVSYVPGTLATGTYTVNLYVEDDAQNTRSATWNFHIDKEPPSFSNAYPANGGTIGFMSPTIRIDVSNQFSNLDATTVKMNFNNIAVTPTFEYEKINDTCSIEVVYNYKKGTIRYYAPNLADGTYPVTVEVADKLGNKATYSWEFTVAVTPTISQYLPTSGSIHKSVDLIRAKVADANGTINASSIVMKLNNQVMAHSFDAATGYVSYVPGTLATGTYTVNLYVEDDAQNSRSATWNFHIDKEPPSFSNAYPANGGTIGFMSPTIRIDVSNQFSNLDAATVKMNFNNIAVTPTFEYEEVYDTCSIEVFYNYKKGTIRYYAPNLADGTYPVTVEVADKLGNKATYSWEFTVAVTPIISQYLPTSGSIHKSVDLIRAKVADANGTINASSIVMKLNNQVMAHSFDAATGYVSYVPGTLATGTYTVNLYVEDDAQNSRSATWNFHIDKEPPSFSNAYPTNGGTIGFMSPTIRIDVSNQFSNLDVATVKMNFNNIAVTPTFEYEEVYDTCSVEVYYNYKKGTISYNASNLTNGTYLVRVEIADALGNIGIYEWEFTY